MKTTIKNSLYAIAGSSLLLLNKANAVIGFGKEKVNQNIAGDERDAVTVIQGWVAFITTFLYIIAILVILWAGFMILTAAGDEEKTKKGKTIIIQAAIGLAVIFIANSIIVWIIDLLFTQGK